MKKGPLILLGVLITTLFFILGMQFGKRVKTADEALELLLTIAPSPSPIDQAPAVPFQNFESSSCSFSFLYPEDLLIKKISSVSGEFIDENQQTVINFVCKEELSVPQEATNSVSLDDENGIQFQDSDLTTIQIEHPTKNFPLVITFQTDYRELIERTFKFKN